MKSKNQATQKCGLTPQGLRQLQDAAGPGKPHAYEWYVFKDINAPEERMERTPSLEAAIRAYAALDCADKRLGVEKDGIAAVDLVIRWDGREWVSEDWTRLESFAQDPTIADAAAKMRQLLENQTPDQGMTMGGMLG